MTVIGPIGVTLCVPDIEAGVQFYTDAGLVARKEGERVYLRCSGQSRDAITLVGGALRKKLHHIALAADSSQFNSLRVGVPKHGGCLCEPPQGYDQSGIWLRDPHGMLIHLAAAPQEIPLAAVENFTINAPARLVRRNRAAVPAKNKIGPILPLRLGHILVFTPNVMRSIDFFERALGMVLADRAQDVVAFMRAPRESDHHVVAFAKSSGVGFHHASFQVASPDEVGIAGRRLVQKHQRGDWGFGRHTIGSNFFHYIQDPWGSWFEYYSDLDYITDSDNWIATNYGLEDALDLWGPPIPKDFVHNYEYDDGDV